MASTKDTEKGKSAVVVSMADAARDIQRQKRRREDPAPEKPRNGILPNHKGQPPNWKEDNLGLPSEDPSPVTPLGTEQANGGVTYHMLDSADHFVSYSPSDFSHAGIQSLFATAPNYPSFHWPRHGKPYIVNKGTDQEKTIYPISSFEDDAVRQAYMRACTRRGLFSATDRVRGRGMWTNKGGGLIYHAGEELWTFDNKRELPLSEFCGLNERYLYARYDALPAPWPTPIPDSQNPVRELLTMLRGPNWTRKEIDPVLLLGWIVIGYLGGAVDWRPAVLLLGGHGTGKSTLQEGLKALFGDALFDSVETSAAGIYQNMKHDTRPVALDESEPDGEHSKIRDVVKLMRVSASGGKGRRGSSGGVGMQFELRSAFLFGAINNPLQSSQDLSRVAVLRLLELDQNGKQPPVINADTCGRMVLHIIMREWPRFHATRERYMAALKDGGHVARGQKTYGTLLAGADLLIGALGEELGVQTSLTPDGQENSAGLAWWAANLAADELPEVEDAKQNWRKCLHHILTTPVDVWRGGTRPSVGAFMADLERGGTDLHDEAERNLAATGLGLMRPGTALSSDHGWILCVPNDHNALKKLFKGSDWELGGWKDALRQCPAKLEIVSFDKKHNRVRIAGEQERCTLIAMKKYQEAPER